MFFKSRTVVNYFEGGRTVQLERNGTTLESFPDGRTLQTNPDGATIDVAADGSQTQARASGSPSRRLRAMRSSCNAISRAHVSVPSSTTMRQVLADGTKIVIPGTPRPSSHKIDKHRRSAERHCDSATPVSLWARAARAGDGSRETTLPDGTCLKVATDGTTVQHNLDGQPPMRWPGGGGGHVGRRQGRGALSGCRGYGEALRPVVAERRATCFGRTPAVASQ